MAQDSNGHSVAGHSRLVYDLFAKDSSVMMKK